MATVAQLFPFYQVNPECALALLHLRCLKASDAWDDFQKQFLNPTALKA